MRFLIVLLLASIASTTLAADNIQFYDLDDHVDSIEYNHFYDQHGRFIFDQLLYRSKYSGKKELFIREWRLAKLTTVNQESREFWEAQTQVPHHLRKPDLEFQHKSSLPLKINGIYYSSFPENDAHGAIYRRITADVYVETHTLYDPELMERDILPKEKRMPLMSAGSYMRKKSLFGD